MWVARLKALEVIRRYRLPSLVSESELDSVFRRMGIRIVVAPQELEIPEFRRGRTIGIRCDQPPSWRLWLKAHGLGHVLLHRGEQAYMEQEVLDKQEHQAEEFAGWLLLSETWHSMESWGLAEYHGLPEDRIRNWLGMIVDRITV